MPLAISTGGAVLAILGLALGAVVLVTVIALFNRVVRPALEIRDYADATLAAGLGIARNLDGVERLARTEELVSALPGPATAFLGKLKGSGQ